MEWKMIEAKKTKTAIVAAIVGSLVLTTGSALWGANLTLGDYTYRTNAAGQATITGFNKNYTGALAITNSLSACPVTSIGNGAFSGRTNLTSVTIPAGVASIGQWAFARCNSLTSVTIPVSVTSIGIYAFESCSGLTSVTIPFSVINIEQGVFHGCTSLDRIMIPARVRRIENDAFSDCTGLKSVTIPDSVSSIEAVTFMGCTGLTSVVIGKGVSSIEAGAFCDCTGLSSIAIPDSVTNIGTYAFFGCSGLTNVTIGKGVSSIGGYAFSSCANLTSVTIPDRVTRIGDRAFSDCTRLPTVTIPASVTSIGNYAFPSCSGVSNVVIPSIQTGLPAMPTGARNLGSPTPVSITTAKRVKRYFFNCPEDIALREYSKVTGLTLLCSPVIPRVYLQLMGYSKLSNAEFCAIIETALRDKGIRIVRTGDTFAKVVPLPADQEEKGLDQLAPATVLITATGAVCRLEFDGAPVEDLLLSYANTAGRSMSVYKDLPRVPISLWSPSDLTQQDCLQAIDNVLLLYGIRLVVLDGAGLGAIPAATLESKKAEAVAALNPLRSAADRSVSVPAPAAVRRQMTAPQYQERRRLRLMSQRANQTLTLGDYNYTTNAAGQAAITRFRKQYTGALVITNALGGCPVTSIGVNAFSRQTNLNSVTIPVSVTNIGERAFHGCTGLTNITIPASVTRFGLDAFSGCTNLPAAIRDLEITEEELKKYFEECQKMQLPMPIPLTREQDDQLVEEGILPPSGTAGNKTNVQPQPEGDGKPAP